MKLKRPPLALAAHRFELVVPGLSDAEIEVNGPSVGLSAAVAFASHWLETPIPGDVACTAGIGPRGHLQGVGGVQAKCTGLARRASGQLRLFLAEANAAEVTAESVESRSHAVLPEVLDALGFDLAQTPPNEERSNADKRRC